ncbi:dihydrolipoamide dehydrogenase [Alkalihalobacillus xiaoxiensis]|uniref:Dihydrolipoamide dehydrogenase n=1 Tax=Shouchella xiaoxiensis TaxID=766895 RepID=A0ABS2T039_9BACI|nr:FAD-dependent oxidoreductase [Shouchella xiaoxiensis]MBM7840084.1 dihydrolipoamide dehydrogenase [Shouchella xiaoxiensis]
MVVGELAQDRQLVIVGGGPGGYHAAIRAAQLGLEVTLIENRDLGGVCLNKGCIPSKVQTQAAEIWNKTQMSSTLGIPVQTKPFEWNKLQQHQDKVIIQLRQGIEQLCKAHKIEVVKGEATFLSDDRIGVSSGHQFDVFRFQHAIIATGHRPAPLFLEHERLLSPHTLYQQNEKIDTLTIVGTDLYALEAAFSYQHLGTQVTLLLEQELLLEPSIGKELLRSAKKAGIVVKKKIELVTVDPNLEEVTIQYKKDDQLHAIQSSHAYVPFNWRGNTEELGLERIGVKVDQMGYVEMSAELQTSCTRIYAIGDVTGTHQLASVAIQQGKVIAERLAGKNAEWDDHFIPVVYRTQPPIASIGWSSLQAETAGREIQVSTATFKSNGYATISGAQEGLCTVIKDSGTDELLGVHIIGEGAAELIHSGTIGLEMGARHEDFIFPMYPHPSFAEVVMEAVEGLEGLAIHQPPSKQTKQTI